MAVASVSELRKAAHKAGFRGPALTIAVAIALAESHGDTTALAHEPDGTLSYGAWQINSVHTTLLTGKNPYDLQQNADMAYALYKDSNFTPWTTYKDSSFRKYLAQAQNTTGLTGTVKGMGGNPITNGQLGDVAGNLNPIKGVDSFFTAISAITQAAFWKRVGIGFLAFLLLLVGLILMVESSKTVRHATAKAGEAAVLA